MKKLNCTYCDRLVSAKKKACKKSCKRCLFWFNKVKNMKIPRVEKLKIMDKLISLPQRCNFCKTKDRLTIDRITPNSKGGIYEASNIQILCYKCNCCIKVTYNSPEEALKNHTEKKCGNCKKIYPLTKEFWHRTGQKMHYRKISKCNFHGICKKCRLEKEGHKFSIVCKRCNKVSPAYTPKKVFCSVSCARKFISAEDV